MTHIEDDVVPQPGEASATFMLSITTNFPSREAAEALVPEEKATFDRLVSAGQVVGGYLAADWHAVWIVVRATSIEAAKAIVMQLPLSRWFRFDDVASVHRIPADEEQSA